MRSAERSRAAQLMVAIDEIVPRAAMAGNTAANGSGAIRVSPSSGAAGPGSLAKVYSRLPGRNDAVEGGTTFTLPPPVASADLCQARLDHTTLSRTRRR